jgi:hypothetical protein
VLYVLLPLGLEGAVEEMLAWMLGVGWWHPLARAPILMMVFSVAPGPSALATALLQRHPLRWTGWTGLLVLLAWSACGVAALCGAL